MVVTVDLVRTGVVIVVFEGDSSSHYSSTSGSNYSSTSSSNYSSTSSESLVT